MSKVGKWESGKVAEATSTKPKFTATHSPSSDFPISASNIFWSIMAYGLKISISSFIMLPKYIVLVKCTPAPSVYAANLHTLQKTL